MGNFINILPMALAALASFAFASGALRAQTDSQLQAILALSGASSEEELAEEELERYLHYLEHPLEVNLSGTSRLLASGLLSRYQVASIEDYRARQGDILSAMELSFVDGFGAGYADLLGPFLSFRSMNLPGSPGGKAGFKAEVVARTNIKDGQTGYGLKAKGVYEDLAEITFSRRNGIPGPSFSAAFFGRKHSSKVVVGDYNLRFGQGLALWSGMSLSGFSTSSSFQKKPSGLSPSYSWSGTGSHRGVAGDFQAGRIVLTAFASFPDLFRSEAPVDIMAGGNACWLGKDGQVAVTAFSSMGKDPLSKLSGDFRWNVRGAVFFGESAIALESGLLALAGGMSLPFGDGFRANLSARRYPEGYDDRYSGGLRAASRTSDEEGVALGLERFGTSVALDYSNKVSDPARRQFKLLFKMPVQLSSTSVISFKVTERIRPYEPYLKFKTGLRMDFDWSERGLSARYGESGENTWKARARIEGCLYKSLAGLSYLEFGRKAGWFSAYLRGTLFFVDNWDDRIYSYERDAPGNFTVPAYYGRGVSLSAFSGAKFRFGRKKRETLKVWFRVSAIGYPFMDDPRPGKKEARFQAMFSF